MDWSADRLSELRIGWLMPGTGFGAPGGLRYWEPVLREFISSFPRTTFITTGPIDATYRDVFEVHSVGSHMSLGQVAQVGPRLMALLRARRFDVLLTIEYGLATLFTVLGRWSTCARVALLQESRPIPGANYSVHSLPYTSRTISHTAYRRQLAARVDAFLANNTRAREYLIRELGVPAEKITCAPYLVPALRWYHPEGAQVPRKDSRTFLFVGQLIPGKGLAHLLRAASLVSQGNRRFSLWILGDGHQREEMERMVEALGLRDVVTFLGHRPYRTLGAFYEAADVFVLPTLYDYRSVAVMEAAAYGMVILDSKYDGGATEFVRHGVNGYVFDPLDKEGLARMMIELIDHPEACRRFGEESRAIATPYTISAATSALRSVVELAVSGAGYDG